MSLLDWFFPRRCFLCGEIISREEDLCAACEEKLPKEPYRRLIALERDRVLKVVSAVPYSEKFRRALHRLKFQNRRWIARPMGRVTARVLPADFKADAVTYVPLSKRSRRNRGYDQSELLARAIAQAAGLPCVAALEKTRETEEQHKLPRARRAANVENAYRAAAEKAAGKRLLLVDDIVTTGATLRVCAQALYAAGALEVYGMCTADTPLED